MDAGTIIIDVGPDGVPIKGGGPMVPPIRPTVDNRPIVIDGGPNPGRTDVPVGKENTSTCEATPFTNIYDTQI